MSNQQLEFDQFFDPDNVSDWLERTIVQNMVNIGAELITPTSVVEGYIEVLLKQPLAEETALVSLDGDTKTLREVLDIMRRNIYKIDRALKTLRAYNAAYLQQHPDN